MKAKRILLAAALSAVSFLGSTQVISHVHDWSLSRGDDGYESGEGITVSDDGYIFTTGVFEQTVEFQPFNSSGTKTSNGSRDVYIHKRGEDGSFVWVQSFGGSSYDDVVAIDIDNESNVYITGRFYGTVDFDPSPTSSFNMTQTGALSADVYISKFDENGNFIWAKKLNGSNYLMSTDITVDDRSDVHVTGSFSGQVDVNPAPSVFAVQLLTSAGSGDYDGFSVTLDQNGIYTKSYHLKGSASDVSITSVAIDPVYNQFFTGEFTGTCDFDHSSSVYNMTSTGVGPDAFIVRFNPFNGFQWAKQLETSAGSYPKSIGLDASNNVYTMGTFSGSIDLNPSSGVNMHVKSSLRTHVYVSKLSVSGNFIFGKTISGSGSIFTMGNVYGKDLHVTESGKAYLTGSFTRTVDFNPGTGTNIITAVGAEDGFICGLSNSGSLWSMSTIESHYSYGYVRSNSITMNSGQDIFTTGNFTEMADFNPTGYAHFEISNGGVDMFIHKLEPFVFFNPFKSNTTAIELSTGEFKIDVYPNPTSDVLNLNVPGEESAQVVLYSLSGQIVYSGEHGAGRSSIQMENLSEGAYILQITQGENTERMKVVKK